jgi:O-antigen/teichoic acid export membrane protein
LRCRSLSHYPDFNVASKSSLHLNIFFNLSGAALPLLVSIIVIPMYLGLIGPSRYGIISLVWLLFGYFGIFDFGLSRATTNLLARPANQGVERQAEIFWTATIVNALIGAFGALAFGLLAKLIIGSFFKVPIELRSELQAALVWVAVLLPLSTTSAVFIGVLEAHERFLELNFIQVLGATLGQLLPLGAVVLFGPQIDIAIAATFLARLVTTVPIFILAVRQSGRATPAITGDTARELFRYGGWVAVSNIAGPVLVSIDQFMIGAVIGVSSVPRYSIPFNIATKILLIPGALSRALFPQLTKLGVDDGRARSEAATITLSRTLVIVCAPLIVISHYALTLWLGADFATNASTVSRIIIFGVWINGVAYVPFAMLQSQGKPGIVARLHVYELLPFFAILWAGLHLFGLVGAALAWSLRVLVDAMFLFRAADFSADAIKKLFPSFIIMVMAFVLSIFVQENVFGSIVFSCAIFISITIYAILIDPTFAHFYGEFARNALRMLRTKRR